MPNYSVIKKQTLIAISFYRKCFVDRWM